MDESQRLWVIGLIGEKDRFCPWLFSIEPLEMVDGKVLRAVEYTQMLINGMPEQIRLNPTLDTWTVNDSGIETLILAVYFSNDYKRIFDILEGMRFSWDILFCSAKQGIEDGTLTFEDRIMDISYEPENKNE